MKKICPLCKKEFNAKPSHIKYCSKECARKAVTKIRMSTCEYCGKEYKVHWKNQKYCCVECAQKGNRKPLNTCVVCGKEFKSKYPEQKYCCHKCHGSTRKTKCSDSNYKRLYSVWQNMKKRCYNKYNKSYQNYGGRGIKVCDKWKDDFDTFAEWALKNGYDKDAKHGECTLDRIDNNGNYCPENCRWVNKFVQANNKRSNKKYTYKGITKTLTQWCKFYKKDVETIRSRINEKGMSFEEAITIPIKSKYKYITYSGRTLTITEWAKEKNLSKDIISDRLAKGWEIQDILEVPRKFDRIIVTYFDITKTIKEFAKDLRTTPLDLYKEFCLKGIIK